MIVGDREAAEFDRLKKSGYFRRRAESIAAEKLARDPLPRAPAEVLRSPQPSVAFAEVVAEPDGSLRPLADFDDEIRTFEDDPKQLQFDAIKSTLLEIAKRDTGDCADPAKRAEAEQRSKELKAITVGIADDLEAEGIGCYRQDEMVVWTEGLHSGIVDEVVRFNHFMMLPSVAARARQPMLAAAGYFLQSRPFARTAVFTSGPRVKLRDIGARLRELNRGLSRLNHGLRKRFGVEMVLRSDELGTPECDDDGDCLDAGNIERDADGDPTFHAHAHVIMHHIGRRPLSREEWLELLRWVGKTWGWWWKELGVLRDARETVKYITKPRELEKLTRPEKAELFRQLRRVKLLQPMGALRAEIKSRDERRMTLDRAPTKDGRVWREVIDWNRWERRKPADAAETALASVCEHGGDPFRVTDENRPAGGQAFTGPRVEIDLEPRCAAILTPGFMPGSIVREPRAVFFGKRIDLDAAQRDPRCVMVREATRDEWLAGVAAARIMVHTCTPTVPAGQAEFAAETVCACRPSTAGPPIVRV